MKNKIKYFMLYPLMLLIVTATLTYNVKELIGLGQRIPFGSSYWKDSLVDAISTNKSIKLGTGDSLYYNGVVVTSGTGGGGIAASDNLTFTGRDSTTDLWRFGDSIRVRGKANFYDNVLISDTLKVSGAIAILDSTRILKNLLLGTTSKMFTNVNVMYFLENAYDYQTTYSTSLMTLDSLNGMNLGYGRYNGNGSGLTSVDAITLKGQDTTHFARTDTLTTERVKAKTEFSDVVTFFLSPVFSALVNFPNGITVTGTATFNGDMVNTGWKNQGAMLNRNKYYRDTVLYIVTTASPPYTLSTFTVAHGVSNWKSIVLADFQLHDDSLNLIVRPNTFPNSTNTTPYLLTYASVDSLNAKIMIPGASVALFNDTCTVFIRYTDYNR